LPEFFAGFAADLRLAAREGPFNAAMKNANPAANPRLVALDLIACVALAASVALATAIVLVATVLLLAGRAEAAEGPAGTLLLKTLDGKRAPRRGRLA